MTFPALSAYLARLSDPAMPRSTLWLNDDGQAEGRFFNCTLTSAFHAIQEFGSGRIAAYEAVARGVDPDAGQSLWRQLDHAASDDESVELDRLCRMLHAINFFRQPLAADADLFLSVHDRLLSAVSINHGHAFRRILDALGLPAQRVVLQLPAVSPNQRWLLGYVMDNYRRNGFRMALNVDGVTQATELLAQVQPVSIRIDAAHVAGAGALAELAQLTRKHGVQLIVRRVHAQETLALLETVAAEPGTMLFVQGADRIGLNDQFQCGEQHVRLQRQYRSENT